MNQIVHERYKELLNLNKYIQDKHSQRAIEKLIELHEILLRVNDDKSKK